MGKKRIQTVGQEEKKEAKRKIIKTGRERGRLTDMGQIALEEAERVSEREKKIEEEAKEIGLKVSKKTVTKKVTTKKRSRRYLDSRKKIDRQKVYPLAEAINLVKDTSITHFNGSIELHLTAKESDLNGEISFPHSTGKEAKIVIADDGVIEKIKKGQIDFDLLLATPEMMKKIAPLAKILGPRGLMPNPKNNTISEQPEKLVKKMAGKTRYKSEKKSPLIHLVVGKVNDPEKKLLENIQAVFNSLGVTKINKAVVCATMGPGIKLLLK